jgi:hypothetical protein
MSNGTRKTIDPGWFRRYGLANDKGSNIRKK